MGVYFTFIAGKNLLKVISKPSDVFHQKVYGFYVASPVLVHFACVLYNKRAVVRLNAYRLSVLSGACQNEPWLSRWDCPTAEMHASGSCKSCTAFHLFTPPVS